jgi:hypothetical protein
MSIAVRYCPSGYAACTGWSIAAPVVDKKVTSLFDCFAASISMRRNSVGCWLIAAEQVHVNNRPPGFTSDMPRALILVYLHTNTINTKYIII